MVRKVTSFPLKNGPLYSFNSWAKKRNVRGAKDKGKSAMEKKGKKNKSTAKRRGRKH